MTRWSSTPPPSGWAAPRRRPFCGASPAPHRTRRTWRCSSSDGAAHDLRSPHLRLREVQREVEDALNVIESWNRVNAVIAYGNGGDIPSNHRDEQELVVLCLRILQAALVFVNTLM